MKYQKGYKYDYIPLEVQSKGEQTLNTFINLLILKNLHFCVKVLTF